MTFSLLHTHFNNDLSSHCCKFTNIGSHCCQFQLVHCVQKTTPSLAGCVVPDIQTWLGHMRCSLLMLEREEHLIVTKQERHTLSILTVKVFFRPHHVGRCCTDVIQVYCAINYYCTNFIQYHCDLAHFYTDVFLIHSCPLVSRTIPLGHCCTDVIIGPIVA